MSAGIWGFDVGAELAYTSPNVNLRTCLLVAPWIVACATTDVVDDGSVSTGTEDGGVRPEGGGGSGSGGNETTSSGVAGQGGGCIAEDPCGDGVDNDCNGTVDDGCECTPGDVAPCFSGAPELEGVGECAAGSSVCNDDGKWGAECDGEVLPGAEVCNGLDDDCNGVADDGFGTLSCGQGVCANTTDECVDGAIAHCDPLPPPDAVEDCDGVDDDCDGTVDEGCTCTNGSTQSCYTGPMGTAGTGSCKTGTQTCVSGQWSACMGEVVPGTETCDALDQDCDGNVNEGSCNAANGLATCQNGGCVLSGCNPGFSNCDGSSANGCETSHPGHSNSAPGEFLGSVDSDAVYGLGCFLGGTCEGPVITEQGTTGRFFTIEAYEDSSCCAYVGMRFELIVPAGVDYDLILSGTACQADPAFTSVNATGVNEVISVWCEDDCGGASNTFDVNVEVRYFSGSSCEPWTLNVLRGAC